MSKASDGKLPIQFRQPFTLEDTQAHGRQRLYRVLHFAHQGALQAQKIARKHEVEDLAAAVFQKLVPEGPPPQQREKMRAMPLLFEDGRTRRQMQLVHLEVRNKVELGG